MRLNGRTAELVKKFFDKLSNETHFVGLSFERLRLAAAHSLRSHVCEPRSILPTYMPPEKKL